MACGVIIFIKNFPFLEEKKLFYFIELFLCYYCCSINLKKAVGTFRALPCYEQYCYSLRFVFCSLKSKNWSSFKKTSCVFFVFPFVRHSVPTVCWLCLAPDSLFHETLDKRKCVSSIPTVYSHLCHLLDSPLGSRMSGIE